MLICFPVPEDKGLESKVYGHFGSAPLFVLVDTEQRETRPLDNGERNHACGACLPLEALGDESIDAVVVSSIGASALERLSSTGLKVYRAQGVTIADNMTCLEQVGLPELAADHACGAHAHQLRQNHLCSH